MPRAFTQDEKATIRERLIKTARDCFIRYGLAKTTIEDLTKPARIAKASFYLFFDSKEALYAQILMGEMPAMMDRLLAASFGKTSNARDALVLLMRHIVKEIEDNPLARVLLDSNTEDLQRMANAIDIQGILAQAVTMFAPLSDAICKAQARGGIIQGDPQQLIYALGLVKLFPLNRDRIPEPLYSQMLEVACGVIADGLTCPARTAKQRKEKP